MYPILFSFGPLHIYAMSIGIVLSWFVYSFVLWRHMKDFGVEDDRIFDITFYSTLVAFITARIWFVIANWHLFAESYLKIIAVWIVPGFSLWGALIGGTIMSIFISRISKVRVGFLLDSIAFAYPSMLLVGFIGSFLDGTSIGTVTHLPWAVRYAGHESLRHPVQLYAIVLMVIILTIVVLLQKRAITLRWPYGLVGAWFFVLYAMTVFILEFIQEHTVYWFSLTVNQWVAVAFFCEGLGVVYVKGGLKDRTVPIIRRLRESIYVRLKGAKDAISKRFTRPS